MGLSEMMVAVRVRFGRTRGTYKYSVLPDAGSLPEHTSKKAGRDPSSFWRRRHRSLLKFTMAVLGLAVVFYMVAAFSKLGSALSGYNSTTCDTPELGFQCKPRLSHSWGQYSPFFSVPSELDADVPAGCTLTFVQILSRHGARDPTSGKTKIYNATIEAIHANATSYGSGFDILRDYEYTLGTDQLTTFGQQEMLNSGVKFFERYRDLARQSVPFIRSSGQARVVESAQNWTLGFYESLVAEAKSSSSNGSSAPAALQTSFPYKILTISEDEGVNNTLSHSLCTAFESGVYSSIGDDAQALWKAVFAPAVVERLNENLPGVNCTTSDAIYLMDLCPFNTVASSATNASAVSSFCNLFTADEWAAYDYYQTLGKWYGYGPGNPMGSTQGVGFVNELIARLTGTPVVDRTSTNASLDDDPKTFPLNRTLYADFSHDNDMTGIFAALGLYNGTAMLSNTTRQSARAAGGYSAAWTVPFAARAYVEKMSCPAESDAGEEELVRVLMNDRVVPLQGCGADALGRCTLGRFVDSLSFARSGGLWDLCFE